MWTEDGAFCSMCRGKMLPYHRGAGSFYGCVTCDLMVPPEYAGEGVGDDEA
jgi:hypothetical protein